MKIIIIGSGITGLFLSYYMKRDGFDVTIVEKASLDVITSMYNAGLITPSFTIAPPISTWKIASTLLGPSGAVYISPREVLRNVRWFLTGMRKGVRRFEEQMMNFAMKSLGMYERFFKEESMDIDLIKGVIGLYRSSEYAKKQSEALGGSLVDERECADLGFEGFGGGIVFNDELSINPPRLFNGLRKRLVEIGVNFEAGEEMGFMAEHGRVTALTVDGRRIEGDSYVVATGARCNELLKPLGYDPRIIPVRGLAMIFDTGGERISKMPALFKDYGIALIMSKSMRTRIEELRALNMDAHIRSIGFNSKG
jgi:D-amino-acid dehydrogenase